MFKLAFAAGVAAEWLLGDAVHSLSGFGFAMLSALMFTLAAWMVLEAIRMLVQAVMALDDGVSR